MKPLRCTRAGYIRNECVEEAGVKEWRKECRMMKVVKTNWREWHVTLSNIRRHSAIALRRCIKLRKILRPASSSSSSSNASQWFAEMTVNNAEWSPLHLPTSTVVFSKWFDDSLVMSDGFGHETNELPSPRFGLMITFRVYIGHGRLCVGLSVSRCIPTLLHGPGCNWGMVGDAL